MNSDYSTKPTHFHSNSAKIVLDYSFCNSSNLWNYLGVVIIVLFVTVLMSYLKHRTTRPHHDQRNGIYLTLLIILGLVFVIPFMCWLLAIVEIFVTFLRYGEISGSPLPILSLPIRFLAFLYMKLVTTIHWYLTAPGTFVFLFFFLTLACLKWIFILILRFRFPAFLICSWIGLAMPLYALIEVGSIESWIDFIFNTQLPLLIICKFPSLLFNIKRIVLSVFLFLLFLVGYFLKFGLTLLFVCKCLLIAVLLRFTYVIGKAFVSLIVFTPKTSSAHPKEESDQ